MLMKHTKQTLFAVPMTCDGCVKDVSNTLYKLKGITKVEANLQEQSVRVEGSGTADRFLFLTTVVRCSSDSWQMSQLGSFNGVGLALKAAR